MKISREKAAEMAELATTVAELCTEMNDYLLAVEQSYEERDREAREDALECLSDLIVEQQEDLTRLASHVKRWREKGLEP